MIETLEWEGRHTRLVRLSGLPGLGYPEDTRRQIRYVFVHATGGARHRGLTAVEALVRHHTQPTSLGGLGLPGPLYTFLVPAVPRTVQGLAEVYRLAPDSACTPHTRGLYDAESVSVGVVGCYRSVHCPPTQGEDHGPDSLAMLALRELVLDFLLPRYGLAGAALRGSFDAGDPASPGDELELWTRSQRSEPVVQPDLGPDRDRRPLGSVESRRSALAELGFRTGAGPWGDLDSRGIQEAQSALGLVPSGRWTALTEDRVRAALAARGQRLRGDAPPTRG